MFVEPFGENTTCALSSASSFFRTELYDGSTLQLGWSKSAFTLGKSGDYPQVAAMLGLNNKAGPFRLLHSERPRRTPGARLFFATSY